VNPKNMLTRYSLISIKHSRKFPTANLSDLIKTIMVPIPKLCNAQECKHYRTISLISHVGKVIAKVIIERMRRKIEGRPVQFP
jgi:hypothetical protein